MQRNACLANVCGAWTFTLCLQGVTDSSVNGCMARLVPFCKESLIASHCPSHSMARGHVRSPAACKVKQAADAESNGTGRRPLAAHCPAGGDESAEESGHSFPPRKSPVKLAAPRPHLSRLVLQARRWLPRAALD